MRLSIKHQWTRSKTCLTNWCDSTEKFWESWLQITPLALHFTHLMELTTTTTVQCSSRLKLIYNNSGRIWRHCAISCVTLRVQWLAVIVEPWSLQKITLENEDIIDAVTDTKFDVRAPEPLIVWFEGMRLATKSLEP